MTRRHLLGMTWVVGGQALTALGTVVGVRLLTEHLPPETFGLITLLLGTVALFLSFCVNPFTQGVLYLYPDFDARGALPMLRGAILRSLLKQARWAVPVLVLGAVALAMTEGSSLWLAFLLALLAICDAWRLVCLSFLNAARRHADYAIWVSIDAWLRPLAAMGAILLFGVDATVVVAAYVVVSALLLIWLASPAMPPAATGLSAAADRDLDRNLRRYALPLAPLGLIGWANGLGDRYLIGGMLTVAEAGLYAAAYGLASRPVMMAGGAIELFIRPIYQSAISAGRTDQARRTLFAWLIGVAIIGTTLTVLIAWFAEPLAALLLGERYRTAAVLLMPWIAAGYLLQGLAQVFERVCYAHGDSRSVLWILAAAAATGLVAIPAGILHSGLPGAAKAVPICFAVELLVAMVFAQRSLRQVAPSPTGSAA